MNAASRHHRASWSFGLVLPVLLLACSEAPAGTQAAVARSEDGAAGSPARARQVAYAGEGAPAASAEEQDRTPPPAKKVPVRGDGGQGGGDGPSTTPPQDPPPNPPQDPPPGGQPQQLGANPNAYAGEKDPKAKLSIEFGKEQYDFGAARQGDVLEHVFELQSTGENPVRIRQASPTCGCTVSEILVKGAEGAFEPYKLGDPIDPQSNVQISAKIDTGHKQNKTNVRINVYTNDPIGLTQLSLSADIEPFIRATPAFLNFNDMKEGTTKTQTIDVRTSRGEPVALRLDPANPIPLPAGMDIGVEPINPDGDGRSAHWRVSVTIGDGASEGSIGYQIRLLTDIEVAAEADHGHDHDHGTTEAVPAPEELGRAPAYHTVTASVSGRILGPLSFTPQFLSMGLVRPGQRVPRSVKLMAHDPDLDLSKVSVELRGDNGQELAWKEHFTTSIQPATGMPNALDIQLQLEGLPDGADGSFRGVVVIHTGCERKPEVEVRFSGVCRAGVVKPAGGGER